MTIIVNIPETGNREFDWNVGENYFTFKMRKTLSGDYYLDCKEGEEDLFKGRRIQWNVPVLPYHDILKNIWFVSENQMEIDNEQIQ